MSGFARHLPLSSRGDVDESAITSDRRVPLAAVLERAAALSDEVPAEASAFAAAAGIDPVADAAGLRAAAAAIRTGPRRRTRALVAAVRALLQLAARRGADPGLDPAIAGMVAFAAAGTAPADRRAVLRGHTVRAADAGWSFGAGPVLEGTATGIVAFLLGESDVPPQPLSPRR